MNIVFALIALVWIIHDLATMQEDYLEAENKDTETYVGSMF